MSTKKINKLFYLWLDNLSTLTVYQIKTCTKFYIFLVKIPFFFASRVLMLSGPRRLTELSICREIRRIHVTIEDSARINSTNFPFSHASMHGRPERRLHFITSGAPLFYSTPLDEEKYYVEISSIRKTPLGDLS